MFAQARQECSFGWGWTRGCGRLASYLLRSALKRITRFVSDRLYAWRFRGWAFVGGTVLLPASLWLGTEALATRFGQPAAVLKSLANLAAITGTAMFAISLVIGARIRVVEHIIGSFDHMYSIHRQLGYVVPLTLVGHALLVASSKATTTWDAGLRLFTPAAGWAVFLGVISLVGLVLVLLLPLLRGMKHETFLLVHRSVAITYVLGGMHVILVPATWKLSWPIIVYLLGLMAAGAVAFIYRSVLGRFVVCRYRYSVEQVNRLSPSVVELVLMPEGPAMKYQAGQFVFATIQDDLLPRQAHPFSVTSAPSDLKLRLVVKALGDYTTSLLDLQPGGSALVEGSYGRFSYTTVGNPRQIWIAGGVGVAPFLSMARSPGIVRYEIDLYYCTEDADDIFFREELLEISGPEPSVPRHLHTQRIARLHHGPGYPVRY